MSGAGLGVRYGRRDSSAVRRLIELVRKDADGNRKRDALGIEGDAHRTFSP
jgi:hypothetical protein